MTLVEIRTGSEYSADMAQVQARQEGTNGHDGRVGEIEGMRARAPFFGGASCTSASGRSALPRSWGAVWVCRAAREDVDPPKILV
jgi:hypothetical protein